VSVRPKGPHFASLRLGPPQAGAVLGGAWCARVRPERTHFPAGYRCGEVSVRATQRSSGEARVRRILRTCSGSPAAHLYLCPGLHVFAYKPVRTYDLRHILKYTK
jgi:hypothetical protein